MLCLCSLDGENYKICTNDMFLGCFYFQMIKNAIPYSPYCWRTVFLQLVLVHQPASERYMYVAKEYSQTISVKLYLRKILLQFAVIIMVDQISECPLCVQAFDQVLIKMQMLLCVFLFSDTQ